VKTKLFLWTALTILFVTLITISEFTFNLSNAIIRQLTPTSTFDTLINFRDLSDYQTKDGRHIKPHKLLRSASLFKLSNHDVQLLHNEYDLNHIIDLRAPIEIAEKPNTPIPQTTYHHLDLYSDGISGASTFTEHQRSLAGKVNVIDEMHNSYKRITDSPYSHTGMRQLFQILLNNNNGSVLWHCSSGKDRTGVPTAILLHILGMTKETINHDYMLSNIARKEANDHVAAEMKQQGDDEQTIADTIQTLTVRQEYLDYTFKLMEDKYGGIDSYIENTLHLNQADRMKLQHMYLI